MCTRNLFVNIVMSKIGSPYIWGGQGPDEFDCSGLVVYAMRRAGVECADTTAQGLFDRYHSYKVLPSAAQVGSLYFYASSQKINHVMILIKKWDNLRGILAGARGGGPDTTSMSIAWDKMNGPAMVDVVTTDYWRSALRFVCDPFRRR